MFKYSLLLSICLPLWLLADVCVFTPPKDWQCTDPSKLSSHVHICFISQDSYFFHPSLNLASEETSLSEEGYIKAVKKIHNDDPSCKWHSLGVFKTAEGKGHLAEIETGTKFGEAKMLQFILVKNGCAYILTGAALKKEFMKYQKDFVAAFRSLKIKNSLWDFLLPDREAKLRQEYRLLKEGQTSAEKVRQNRMEQFQNRVLSEYQELGAYWQILFLKDAYLDCQAIPAQ